MADTARTEDPLIGFNFVLEIDGKTIGYFTDVGGLGLEIEVVEVQEGGQNQFTHKLPGRMKWTNITLKRGITSSKDLFEWATKSAGDGFSGSGNQLERTTGKVAMLDATGSQVQAWSFDGAYPVKWTGPTMSADSNDIATEELEIAHHGFTAE